MSKRHEDKNAVFKFMYGGAKNSDSEESKQIKDLVQLFMESIVLDANGSYTEIGEWLTDKAARHFDLYTKDRQSWPHWLQLMGMQVSNKEEARRHGHDL